jgi:4-amino-4-deoxy-L-arabinose transferase-like glycosyltransferase
MVRGARPRAHFDAVLRIRGGGAGTIAGTLPAGPRPSSSARRFPAGTVALLALLAAAVVAAVSVRPLTHSEVRYVEAGAEMASSGDWVVPHLAYVPYFEKPILTYWAEAAAQLAFGSSPLAARVPSIAAALAMLGLTYAFGRAVRGPAFGVGAAALLVASVVFELTGTAVTTDPLFAAFLTAAWYAFWRHRRAPDSAWIWAFWASAGLAVLTKGPLGAALLLASVGAYLVLAGRVRDLLAMRLARGALVVLAINLPWTIAAWVRDPRYVEFFYLRQNLRAFADGGVNHGGPFWYYVPIVAVALFPFAVVASWALVRETWSALTAGRARVRSPDCAPAHHAHLYLVCVVVAPLLVLSAAGSKLSTYVLPLYPAIALLVAWHVADRLERPSPLLRWATLAQAALLAVATAAAPFLLRRAPADWAATARDAAAPLVIAAGALVLSMAAGGVAMARRRIVPGMAVAGAGALVAVLVVDVAASRLGVDGVGTALASELARARKPGEPVVLGGRLVDDYTVVRALGDRPFVWGNARELGMGHFTEATPVTEPLPDDPYDVAAWGRVPLPQNRWLVDGKRLEEMWRGPSRVWLETRAKDLRKLRRANLPLTILDRRGGVAVVTNWPLP